MLADKSIRVSLELLQLKTDVRSCVPSFLCSFVPPFVSLSLRSFVFLEFSRGTFEEEAEATCDCFLIIGTRTGVE